MGPIWGRQDPVGPHVGLMNVAIWGKYSMDEWVPYCRNEYDCHQQPILCIECDTEISNTTGFLFIVPGHLREGITHKYFVLKIFFLPL